MSLRTPSIVRLFQLLAFCLLAAPATAQIHHLEDLPWHAAADSSNRRGVLVSWDQFRDSDTHWRTDRFSVTALMPTGEQGVFFVRAGYLRFDTADARVFDRWPRLRAVDDDGASVADEDWPGESMVGGFAQPALGLIVPFGAPGLGAGNLGLQVGLPIGSDELYPLASRSLPLIVDWRRPWSGVASLFGAVRVGYEQTLDSSGDELDAEAFPDGLRYGLELGTDPQRDRGLVVDWAARELASGHHSRRLQLSGWLPAGAGTVVRLHLARDLGGRADRYATWTIGLSWSLAGLPRDDEPAPGP